LGYLIDTDIAINARDGTDAVLAKLAEHDGEVLLSALSLAELLRGVYRDRSLPRYGRLGWRFCCAGCRCCRSMPQPPSPTAGSLRNAAEPAGAITTE
jgi:hypothetical protein